MKCPLNNFETCYGNDCEWYITDKGLCSFALIANYGEELREIKTILQILKDAYMCPLNHI